MEKNIQTLIKLKEYIDINEAKFKEVALRAEKANAWFTQEFIAKSANAIISGFLDEEQLSSFAAQYEPKNTPKTIGLVLAGNIPMVGFHDLLCGILSGHHLKIKLSGKDTLLMQHIIDALISIDSNLASAITIADRLKDCDAYIATGSNQTNVYFKQYFGQYPNILRRNRTSVAILNGTETANDLKLLANDVHWYFGLGCRNITKLYVPENYNFEPLIKHFGTYNYFADMHKHKNNYDYQLSLLLLNQKVYMSTAAMLLVEKEHLQTPLAVLNYEYYTDKNKVLEKLKGNEDVQAIVGQDHIPFGAAQQPSINDFADGVDTMAFLTSL